MTVCQFAFATGSISWASVKTMGTQEPLSSSGIFLLKLLISLFSILFYFLEMAFDPNGWLISRDKINQMKFCVKTPYSEANPTRSDL
jgi:hypothetical protein